MYHSEVKNRVNPMFDGCFNHLGGLSDKEPDQVIQAIDYISDQMLQDTKAAEQDAPPKLVLLKHKTK